MKMVDKIKYAYFKCDIQTELNQFQENIVTFDAKKIEEWLTTRKNINRDIRDFL